MRISSDAVKERVNDVGVNTLRANCSFGQLI